MSALPNFDNQTEPPADPDLEPRNKTYWTIRRFLDSTPPGIYNSYQEFGDYKQTVVFSIPELTEMQALAILDPGEEQRKLTVQLENIRTIAIIRAKWKRRFYNPDFEDGSGINVDIAFVYPDNSIKLFESGGIMTRKESINKLLYAPRSGRIHDRFTIFQNTFHFTSLTAKAIREENIAICPPELIAKVLGHN